jgi:hypothetical protein
MAGITLVTTKYRFIGSLLSLFTQKKLSHIYQKKEHSIIYSKIQ